MKTGLQCTSFPRRLSVQAISSSAERMIADAPFLIIASWMRLSFSVQDAPVYVSSRMKTGVVGKLGRSNQMESKMSSVIVSNAKPVDFNSLLIDWASWCEFTQPSIPTLSPFSNTLVSHSAMDGVSGKRSLKRRIPVPSNCSSAWMKYRESVHNPASSRVMTAVPAEPVKPLIHLRVSQCSDTYSLE